jgi:hypothetical protein
MLQFGNAMYPHDAQNGDIMALVKAFQLQPESRPALIEQLRALVKASPTPGRSLLVYARLTFWDRIPYALALDDLAMAINLEGFNRLGAFERIELACCLGPRLTSDLLKLSLEDAAQYRDFDRLHIQVQREYEADEVWVYSPPPTGFFSIIENIILAQFLCALQKKAFRLDERFELWWRYPVPFRDLFQGLFGPQPVASDKPVKYIGWNTVREIMASAGPSLLQAYANFKHEEYKAVKMVLRDWLSRNGGEVGDLSDAAIYYIRGGDKLVLETMVPPAHVVESDFGSLYRNSARFLVLSDDYQLAQEFVQRFAAPQLENITEQKFKGYFVQSNTVDDVRAIARNYLTLASVKYSMSCPSSNLVNAAHFSNSKLQLLVNLNSTPLQKYGYL